MPKTISTSQEKVDSPSVPFNHEEVENTEQFPALAGLEGEVHPSDHFAPTTTSTTKGKVDTSRDPANLNDVKKTSRTPSKASSKGDVHPKDHFAPKMNSPCLLQRPSKRVKKVDNSHESRKSINMKNFFQPRSNASRAGPNIESWISRNRGLRV